MQAVTEKADGRQVEDTVRQTGRSDAYPILLDAIVLAGTHQNPKRLIMGGNKSLLKLGDQVLFRYVIDALLEANSIDHIYVVGPAEDLLGELSGYPDSVHVIAQRGKMLTNAWAGIEASEDRHRNHPDLPVDERPLLIISSDLPLVTARSIDDFISRCAVEDNAAANPYAMLVGVVDEPGVKPFHPSDDKPGIKRPFVELAWGRLRLANIYVGRPRKLARQEFLQTGFSHRKAKDWRNVVALIFDFFKTHGGWAAAWMTIRVQVTLMLSKKKGRWYQRLKKGNTQDRIESCVSEVLGGPVKTVITPFGGLSLDVDDEEDFRILNARYKDWADVTSKVIAQPPKPEGNSPT